MTLGQIKERLQSGEYDFLRFSADIFTKRCVDHGKLRRTIRYQGCDHGFLI